MAKVYLKRVKGGDCDFCAVNTADVAENTRKKLTALCAVSSCIKDDFIFKQVSAPQEAAHD